MWDKLLLKYNKASKGKLIEKLITIQVQSTILTKTGKIKALLSAAMQEYFKIKFLQQNVNIFV